MADAFPWDQPSFRFPRRRTALRNFFPGWPVSSREIKSDSNGSLLPLPSLFSFFFPLFTVALIFCARGFTNAPPLCAKRADTTNERRTNETCVSRAASPADPLSLEFVYRPHPCVWFCFVVEPSVWLSLSIRVRFVWILTDYDVLFRWLLPLTLERSKNHDRTQLDRIR